MLVVLLCIIYQLNFTIFMYVTQVTRYILCLVLSTVSRNPSRSWNILPVDTGTLLYFILQMPLYSEYLNQYQASNKLLITCRPSVYFIFRQNLFMSGIQQTHKNRFKYINKLTQTVNNAVFISQVASG
jgi:hypothetical protein